MGELGARLAAKLAMMFGWMAWTRPVALFFTGIALMLVGMAIWEVRSPTRPRRGLLPMVTTRGDRLFVGLLCAAFFGLAWIGVTDLHPWIGAGIGALLVIALMVWG